MPNQRINTKPKNSNILDSSFRVLAETSPTGIYLTDNTGQCLYVNPAWCNMAGLTPTEAFGDGWIKAIHPDDSVRILSEWNDFVKGNIPWESEYRFKDAGGNIIWVYGTATLFKRKDGLAEGVIGVNIDITDRKLVEEEIKGVNDFFQNIFDLSPVPMVLSTFNERIVVDANLALENLLGYSPEELIAKPITDFDFWEKPEEREVAYKILLEKGTLRNYEFSFKTKSGKKGRGALHSDIIVYKGVKFFLTEIFSITDRKQTEDDLRKSKKLLEKLNQHLHKVWESEKSQIAMNLHDDLGQRLTGLYMDMAWIKSRIGVQSAAVRKKFTGINESLNEIIEFIKDVSFSLMPAILLELGIVPAIISHLNKFEAQSGIKCSFEYDPEEIVLEEGLSLVLYRVFQESLTNIVRHSQASHTEVNLRMLKGSIELSIKDDGIGIDKDKIDSLTSMGIAGIKARVKLVNGTVQIIGKKNSGTIIKATIPLNKRKQR